MIGFGFSVFTQAILGIGGGFRGSALNLDFTSGNRVLDPRVTFSRTTNATLTNSAGLVANAPMNLLTFSEQFDNAAWAKTNATVTANNTVAPNGTTTADKLIADVTLGQHRINLTPTSPAGAQTLSVYAKAAEYGFVWLRIGLVGAAWSLSTGTAFLVDSGVTVTSTAVGNGWYRFSMTLTASANDVARVNVLASASVGDYTGDGVSGIYIWGAQLELGSTATTYNPTTVKNLLGFTEHFDNAAWTKSNAFVQTNNLRWSEDFTNSLWIKGGTATASTPSTLNFPALNDIVSQEVTMTATAGTAATFSVVLSGTGTVYLAAYRSGGGAYEQTRIKITLTTTPTRYSVTHTMVNSGNTGFGAYLARSTDGTATTFTATQAQLVNGTSAGDYKATYAAAAAVGYTDIYGQPFAQKLVEDTANSTHRFDRSFTFSAVPHTASIYLKAAERSWALVRFGPSALNINAYFDLSAGVTGTVGAGVTSATITPVGNGWYRCSISGTPTAVSDFGLIVFTATANGTVTYTGDGTSGIYIFGAQLSDSASVDPYVYQPVAAPSSVAYYGPRFDYDPVTLAPKGLLIEEQRSNLLLNSATLSTQVVTVAATAHTLSFYGTGTIVLSGASTGTVVGTGAYPARTTLTFTPTVGVLTLTVTGSVTMAQLEVGAFATSYIPTAASQVTRAADSASMIGNNFARWYTQGPGTVFADYSTVYQSAAYKTVVQLTDGSNNYVSIRSYSVSGTTMGSNNQVVTAGSTVADLNSGAATTPFALKVSLAYATNDFSSVANGGTVSTETLGAVPVGLNAMNMLGGTFQNGSTTIKRFAYYSRKLSPAEQQGITS